MTYVVIVQCWMFYYYPIAFETIIIYTVSAFKGCEEWLSIVGASDKICCCCFIKGPFFGRNKIKVL